MYHGRWEVKSSLRSEGEKHRHSWSVEFGEASGSGYEESTRENDEDFNNKKACVTSSKEKKCGTIHTESYNI